MFKSCYFGALSAHYTDFTFECEIANILIIEIIFLLCDCEVIINFTLVDI